MGSYNPTAINFKHMQWCIANNIKISPFAKSTYEWYIDVEINGRQNRSPYVYVKTQIWEEIFNYYKYYYNKYAK